MKLYVGSYTRQEPHVDGIGAGIYTLSFDPSTLSFERLCTNDDVGTNPTFLCWSIKHQVLYAVNECENGSVSVYDSTERGKLNLLDRKPSKGDFPCHVALNESNTMLSVTNYASGNAIVYQTSGRTLGQMVQFETFKEGSRVFLERQEGSHPHSSLWLSDTETWVADLGSDTIWALNGSAARRRISCSAGSGPRHMAWHPKRRWLYVAHELSNQVCVYQDAQLKQTLSTLPPPPSSSAGGTGVGAEAEAAAATQNAATDGKDNLCAHLEVTSCGRYLYCSNRGHDSLACFRIGETDGRLSCIGHVSTGKTPRHFTVYQDFVFVTNQDSNSIAAYKIEWETGRLNECTDASYELPSPVCVVVAVTH